MRPPLGMQAFHICAFEESQMSMLVSETLDLLIAARQVSQCCDTLAEITVHHMQMFCLCAPVITWPEV